MIFDKLRPKAELTTSESLEEVFLRGVGRDTKAGISISAEAAMMAPVVQSIFHIISETLSQVPLILYRRDEMGKFRAPDHPIYTLLHDQPNSFQDSFQFREMMQIHLCGWGNCYAFKNRVRGEIKELLPIHPDRVDVEQDERWKVIYNILLPDGTRREYETDDIFHIRDWSVNGVRGMSRIKYGKESIALALATEQFGSKFFGNGAQPSGILSTEQNLGEETINLLRESWKAVHGGDNQLGTAIMDSGIKYTPLSFTNEHSQFLETRKHQVEELARIWRMPTVMLGHSGDSSATYASAEQFFLAFTKFTMMPWFSRWEHAINTQLITDQRRSKFFAEFLVDGLQRGDAKSRSEYYRTMVDIRAMSPNEVRERENMNREPGLDVFENPAITPGGNDDQDTEETEE